MKTKFESIQTANPGTGWATLPDVGCSEFSLFNQTSVIVELRRADDTGNVFNMPAKGGLGGIKAENLNEYEVRRQDQSNTQVTLDIAYDA